MKKMKSHLEFCLILSLFVIASATTIEKLPPYRSSHQTHMHLRQSPSSVGPKSSTGRFYASPLYITRSSLRKMTMEKLRRFSSISSEIKSPVHLETESVVDFPFDELVLFGDSISGPGADNLFLTNGPVWWQYIRDWTGNRLHVLNYARAHATLLSARVDPTVPSLEEQISNFISDPATSVSTGKKRLYVIWVGANDLMHNPLLRYESLIDKLQEEIDRIIDFDQSASFLIPTILPGDVLPVGLKFSERARLRVRKALINRYCKSIRAMAENYQEELGEDRMILWDAMDFFRRIIDDPGQLGLNSNNSRHRRMMEKSVDGNGIFYDQIHPTTIVHEMIAKKVVDIISNLDKQ